MASLIDQIRVVPETAVRLYLGASITSKGDTAVVELDGRSYPIDAETLENASGVAKALMLRERVVNTASDVLELRHAAEEIFLERILGAEDLPKVLFVPSGELAGSFYRAIIPADTLNNRRTAIANHTFRLDVAKALRYDVLWVQLITAPTLIQICERVKAEGVKIVYDVDDRFEDLPDDIASSDEYRRWVSKHIWQMVRLADVVTVSTRALADFVRPEAKNVRVLHNHIPASYWPKKHPGDPSIFRILWAGSPTHRRDLAIAAPALRKVLERHAGKVRFTCFGEAVPEELAPVRQHVDTKAFVGFDEYPEALASVGADVMIAPLLDDAFNSAKSDVKVLEAGACGYPILCSPVGEYSETFWRSATFSLVEDTEWEEALEYVVKNRAQIPAMGENLKEWVLGNRCVLTKNAEPWLEAVRALLPKKADGRAVVSA